MTESTTRQNHQEEPIQPWYKQGWPWFLISLPLSAVIAGTITIIIATKGADSLVDADYYKEGLAINESLEREREAIRRGLSFRLTQLEKQLSLTPNTTMDDRVLYLLLQHPVDEKKDITLVFSRSEDTYLSQPFTTLSVNYRYRLYPADKAWQINGRWHPSQSPSPLIQAQ